MLSSIYFNRESTYWRLNGASCMLQTDSFFKGCDRSGRAKLFAKQLLSEHQRAINAVTCTNFESAQKLGPQFDFSFTPGSYASLRYVLAHRLKHTITDRLTDPVLALHKASQWTKMPAGSRLTTYDGCAEQTRLKREDLARHLSRVPGSDKQNEITAEQVVEWMWLPNTSSSSEETDNTKLVFHDPSLLFPSDKDEQQQQQQDYLVLDERYGSLAHAYFICSELLHAFAVPAAIMCGREEKIEETSLAISRLNPEDEEDVDEDDAVFQFEAALKTYLPLMRDLSSAMIDFLGTKIDQDVAEKSIAVKRVEKMSRDLQSACSDVVQLIKHVSEYYEEPILAPFDKLHCEIASLHREAMGIVGLQKPGSVPLTEEKHAEMKRALAKHASVRKNGNLIDDSGDAKQQTNENSEETRKPSDYVKLLVYTVFGEKYAEQLYPAVKFAVENKKRDPEQVALVLKRVPTEKEKCRLREIVHELMLRSCIVNPECWPWEIKERNFDEKDATDMIEWVHKWVVDEQNKEKKKENEKSSAGKEASSKAEKKAKKVVNEEPVESATPITTEQQVELPQPSPKENENAPSTVAQQQIEREKATESENRPLPAVYSSESCLEQVTERSTKRKRTNHHGRKKEKQQAEEAKEKEEEENNDEKEKNNAEKEEKRQEAEEENNDKKEQKKEEEKESLENTSKIAAPSKKRKVVVRKRKRTSSELSSTSRRASPAKTVSRVQKRKLPTRTNNTKQPDHTVKKMKKTLRKDDDKDDRAKRFANKTEFLKEKRDMLSDLSWIDDKRDRTHVGKATGHQRTDILFMYYVNKHYELSDAELFGMWQEISKNTTKNVAKWPTEKSPFVIRAILAAGRQYEDPEKKPTNAQIAALTDAYEAAQFHYKSFKSAYQISNNSEQDSNQSDDNMTEDETVGEQHQQQQQQQQQQQITEDGDDDDSGRSTSTRGESENESDKSAMKHVTSTSSDILAAKSREHAVGKIENVNHSGSSSSSSSSCSSSSSSSSDSSEELSFALPPI